MNQFSFRPRVETLDGRCLPSGNPALSITDASVVEGNSGQAALVFTVRLSEASAKEVSVKFATANGTATTGEADYVAKSGALTFAPGETTKTVTILVNGDTTVEGNESLFVNLSGARNATLADARGAGTILNDDSAVQPPLPDPPYLGPWDPPPPPDDAGG